MKPLLIKGSRLIDPSQDLDTVGDLLIEDGKIKAVGNNLNFPYAEIIDGRGLILCPSFVDVHVHFRDPGQTYKEDIESGSKCAVAGGLPRWCVCPRHSQP
jgi:dihydroorotase (EC 3.5.2.3)